MPERKGAPHAGWRFIRMKTGMIQIFIIWYGNTPMAAAGASPWYCIAHFSRSEPGFPAIFQEYLPGTAGSCTIQYD
jgi:hypothetical protein